MQGELRFRYWIVPLSGTPDRAALLGLGQQLAGGLRQVYLEAQSQPFYRQGQALPAESSFLSVEGPAVLTSLRRTPAGLEARLLNPQTEPGKAALQLGGQKVEQAQVVDFEHNPVGEPLPVKDGRVELTLKAKQILTIVVG
jgi:hypothetical protein